MRRAVAHLFAVASARAAGGSSAWTRCAGENGTCHCPGGAVRLGWARRDLWGPPVATRLASDGVNHGATTCAEARVPAPGVTSRARGRRSCQCTNAEPLRAVTAAWTARKNTVCTPPDATVCDADVRQKAAQHLLDLKGAVRATAAAACGCDVVVFTTAFYEAGFFPVPLAHKIPPIYDGGFAAKAPCLVAVVNEATAAAFRREGHSPWRVVAVQGTAGRRAAKIPKLLPHIFFPEAGQTLFVDHKLTLHAHPLELIARLLPDERAAVGAFAHPCAVDMPRPGLCAGFGAGAAPPGADARTSWLYDEGHAVLVGNRTATRLHSSASLRAFDATAWWSPASSTRPSSRRRARRLPPPSAVRGPANSSGTTRPTAINSPLPPSAAPMWMRFARQRARRPRDASLFATGPSPWTTSLRRRARAYATGASSARGGRGYLVTSNLTASAASVVTVVTVSVA